MARPTSGAGELLASIALPEDRPIVATIGNFDGVHLGHRALLDAARALATGSGCGPNFVLALAFHPHPATVLRPGSEPAALTDWGQRDSLLRGGGADAVGALAPTRDLLALEPEEFFDALVARYRLAGVVEGHDFHFGRSRRGTPELLGRLAGSRGIACGIVGPVEVALQDQSIVTASSTIVRWLIGQGRIADAWRVLGRPHAVAGEVVRGDRLGRTIGVPTANLRPAQLLPGDGVYAGIATLGDGRRLPAAIHVGPRATLNDPRRTCEAHILGWGGPACTDDDPEYGWRLGLEFIAWLRGQARFESLEALVEQMGRDIARAAEFTARLVDVPPAERPLAAGPR